MSKNPERHINKELVKDAKLTVLDIEPHHVLGHLNKHPSTRFDK